MDKLIPGTQKEFVNEDSVISFFNTVGIANGLSLGQVCSITGNEPFVIQNWVKRGYVSRPIKKRYHEKQFARILMINSLKDAMRIEDIGRLMTLVNGDVEDESDDLISEVDLFLLLSKAVYRLDNYSSTEKIINEVMKEANNTNEKLFTALDIMVNGYISGRFKQEAQKNLILLEKIK